jgi:uncharacterized protein YjbI with pentapeptide repeats
MARAVRRAVGTRRTWTRRLSATGALALAATAFGVACEPADCTTSWTGPATGSWSTGANWDAGVPDAADVACLPAGTDVSVAGATVDVAGLKARGRLTVTSGTTFQIAHSAIDAGATTLIDVEGGATLRVGGGDGTLTLYGGTLAGTGTLDATLERAGRIEPGDPDVSRSRGSLTVTGSATLLGTTIEIDLAEDGIEPGVDHDVVTIAGMASVDPTSTITVDPAPGTDPPGHTDIRPVEWAGWDTGIPTVALPDFTGRGFGGYSSLPWVGVDVHLTDCDPATFHPGASFGDAFLDGTDLRACDLSGADFSGADLNAVAFDNAALNGADFTGADMSGATMRQTDASGANLQHADLQVVIARYADLSNAQLQSADLGYADLLGAQVGGAQLAGANADGLHASSLTGTPASLPSAAHRIVATHLLGPRIKAWFTNLDGANLTGLDLTGADLSAASLQNANLTDVILTGVNISNARFTGATLTGVRSGGLVGTGYTGIPATWSITSGHLIGPGADLTGATLNGTNLSGRSLTGIDLTDATLTNVNLTNAGLGGAVITGLRTSGLVGTPTTLPTSTTLRHARLIGPGVDLSGVSISSVDFVALDLTGADLSGATLSDGDLRYLKLTNANLAGATFSNVWVDGLQMTGAQMGSIPVGGTFGTNLRFYATPSMAPPANWFHPGLPTGVGFTITRIA